MSAVHLQSLTITAAHQKTGSGNDSCQRLQLDGSTYSIVPIMALSTEADDHEFSEITRRKSKVKETEEVNSTMPNHSSEQPAGSTRNALLILVQVFVISVLLLFLAYYNFPKLEPDEVVHIKLPKNIDDAKNLGNVLSRYTGRYYFTVMAGFFLTYIFLQTFAIPGSIFLSILSGFLFSFPLALFLVCLCSALGASFCFVLSYLVGRRLVIKYLPDKVAKWSEHVNQHRSNLLNYIIFLRITPFLPNWFINITAPVIEVPLVPFFIGTFLGVAPPSFVAIRAGTTLQQLTSSSDALSWSSIALLASFALLAVIPVLFKRQLQAKLK